METFDLTRAMPQHTASANTQRAYFRWIERFFVEFAEWKSSGGLNRLKRMSSLKVILIQRHVKDKRLKQWLDSLVEAGTSRQSLDQARAAIVTLAELSEQAGHLDSATLQALRKVHVPNIRHKQTPERLLSQTEVQQLLIAARECATSDNQRVRNQVVVTMLTTMPLRREELASARWSDLALLEGKVVLRVAGGKVDVPRPVVSLLDRWRGIVSASGREPVPASPLIRRIWKGGTIARVGLSSDGIWLIIKECATHANLGNVTPDDLRRSMVAHLWSQGTSSEDLSKILRHRNVNITEKFLARLQVANQAEANPETDAD